MFSEVESDTADEDAQKEGIEARNQVQNFCHQVKNIVESSLDNMSRVDKSVNNEASKIWIELQDTHKMRRSQRSRRRCKLPTSRVSPSQVL